MWWSSTFAGRGWSESILPAGRRIFRERCGSWKCSWIAWGFAGPRLTSLVARTQAVHLSLP